MKEVHALYNLTFSKMVMNNFLPLIVLNLECDYYIEKITLFVAIPISTNYTLLIVCIFSVYLSQTELSGGKITRVVHLLTANLRFPKKTLMAKIYAFNKTSGNLILAEVELIF